MATIRDVAERAGVAPITVSRVLNDSGYVSAETRARVENAAAELNYVPNMTARSFRSQRSNSIALILSDITNPFWTTVARGVEDVASQRGFTVLFCNTDENSQKQEAYLSVTLRRRVDGVLLVPVLSAPEAVLRLQRHKVPVVVLDRRVPGAAVDVVRGTSTKGSRQLVEHLVAYGHQRIAILAGREEVSTSNERIAGYREALTAAGLPIQEELIVHGDFSVESGQKMTHHCLQLNEPPTALFATNNFIAIGALKALGSAGLRVPEDLSLVSFDDLPAYAIEPFITVVSQPAYTMGQIATELLLERIEQGVHNPPQEIDLPTQFIERNSVRAHQPL